MSGAAKAKRRTGLAPLSELRAERLRAALTLFAVAEASGICSSYRLSIIERGLDEPTPEELAKLHEAIARLANRRMLLDQEPNA
jgi:transcriptional regulator with XRE-family HTH domain